MRWSACQRGAVVGKLKAVATGETAGFDSYTAVTQVPMSALANCEASGVQGRTGVPSVAASISLCIFFIHEVPFRLKHA